MKFIPVPGWEKKQPGWFILVPGWNKLPMAWFQMAAGDSIFGSLFFSRIFVAVFYFTCPCEGGPVHASWELLDWNILGPSPKTLAVCPSSSRFHPGSSRCLQKLHPSFIRNWNRLHPGFIPVPPKTSSWFYPIFFLCFILMFHPGVRMQFVKPGGFILIILVVFHPAYTYCMRSPYAFIGFQRWHHSV